MKLSDWIIIAVVIGSMVAALYCIKREADECRDKGGFFFDGRCL